MSLQEKLESFSAEFISFRRDLHAHPEIGFEETRTAKKVTDKLKEYGIEVHTGYGKTGIIGVLKKGNGQKIIGLRADMDALPMQEFNQFAHKSGFAGKMHACGHDGHTTMLLMAAKYLALYGQFNGTVIFIFQAAEEIAAGAKSMLDDGIFTRFPVESVYGLHNMPGFAAGSFVVTPGPIMASVSEFRITITGVGAHGAMPDNGHDPLFTAVQLINGLQGIITRNKKPIESAVLSVTQFHSGDAMNIIPDSAWISGTVRTFSHTVLNLIESRMKTIAQNIATSYECSAEVIFTRMAPATINSKAETEFAVSVMKRVAGENNVDDQVEPTMGGEDFAFFLQAKPGCFAFIGNGNGEHREPGYGSGPCLLHNPSFDFNDNITTTGAEYWVTLTESLLK